MLLQFAAQDIGQLTDIEPRCVRQSLPSSTREPATLSSATLPLTHDGSFRDDLRARLRQAGLGGVPVLTEATAMIGSYLTAERELGRIATDADVGALAPTLIGAVHLLFAGREGTPPQAEAVRKVVVTVIACAIPG